MFKSYRAWCCPFETWNSSFASVVPTFVKSGKEYRSSLMIVKRTSSDTMGNICLRKCKEYLECLGKKVKELDKVGLIDRWILLLTQNMTMSRDTRFYNEENRGLY